MNIDLIQAQSVANQLARYTLQRFTAGPSTGSIVGLYFGPAHTGTETASWYLQVGCSWRVEGADGLLLACSTDDNAAGGALQTGLDALCGHTIASVAIVPPASDLLIEFEGGPRLIAFADNLQEGRLCWYLSDLRGGTLSVEPAGRIRYQAPTQA